MSVLVGLTGSIGMGKSTTARMFHDLGVPVWDADAAVHRIYEKGGAGADALREIFPDAVVDGAVSRDALKTTLKEQPHLLKTLEDIIHPLVAEDRARFIRDNTTAPVLLFDIPLLFETDADEWLDHTIVVSVAPDIQRARVLERPGMSEDQFNLILSRQMPDAEKRERADFIIETVSIESARDQVSQIYNELKAEHA